MADTKRVLIVGLDPNLIDFSQPGYAPGMTAAKVHAGMKATGDESRGLGYEVEMCLTDFGETAEAVVRERLKGEACMSMGGGRGFVSIQGRGIRRRR